MNIQDMVAILGNIFDAFGPLLVGAMVFSVIMRIVVVYLIRNYGDESEMVVRLHREKMVELAKIQAELKEIRKLLPGQPEPGEYKIGDDGELVRLPDYKERLN